MAQILKMDDENGRMSGALRSGVVEVCAEQQRRINESGVNVLQPVAVVRVNGSEVGRLIGAEKGSGSPAALVQIAEKDPSIPTPKCCSRPLRNGRILIVDLVNRFLYRFACYSYSSAPARIWELQGDAFVDVSHRPEFKPIHRRNLQRMSEWFQQKNSQSPQWVCGRVRGQPTPCGYAARSSW